MWVYFWALSSIPLIYVFVFMSVPYCFDYYSFVVRFGIRECYASSLVLLSQKCFGYWGSHGSIQTLELLLSISVKNATRTLMGIALNLYMALGNIINILRILIFLSMNMGYLSISLCPLNFFHQCLTVFSVQIFHFLG